MQTLHDAQLARSSLRERRRLQTAREIQLAALRLALEHGLEAVTTEMIARDAAVSVRTFFNYFPNKEAALIGNPPRFLPADIEAFVTGEGPLSDDLRILMRSHLAQVEQDREILKALLSLRGQSLRLHLMHESFLLRLRQELFAVLQRRRPSLDAVTLDVLTSTALEAGRLAIDTWLAGDEQSISFAVDDVWVHLQIAGGLLADMGAAS